MKKKRFLILAVLVLVLLCLAACGPKQTETPVDPTPVEPVNPTPDDPDEPDEPVEEELKVEIDITSLTLIKGESATLNVKANKEIDSDLVKWRIDNSDVAKITKNEFTLDVKAGIAGTATIKLYYDGKSSGECVVNVNKPELYVHLPQDKIVLTAGKTVTVAAVCSSEGEATWQSSDDSVVSLENQGLICRLTVSQTATAGTYYVTVKVGELSYRFEVIVIEK